MAPFPDEGRVWFTVVVFFVNVASAVVYAITWASFRLHADSAIMKRASHRWRRRYRWMANDTWTDFDLRDTILLMEILDRDFYTNRNCHQTFHLLFDKL
ncbi:hypothetical protein PRIPAC_80773 [Pristionchus pacificus]|uniref:Uncharacterized protein n=1 Tax=Pristionchus pacificus TaxID=54126 RepID=A0A2A6CLM1_PRIPA|nr:hypothetical protein PRIPAC_80773 [Pristionchus pacificus]|eukprot:PDM78943.1 hypothetical protein PRIPAC_31522 [Pristionchus pacificus]